MKADEPLYPIREVSRLTGVNAITLRAWERRYGLVEPVRTPSGHRLYTYKHILRLKEALKLTEQGVPISRVKRLLDKAAKQQSDEKLSPEKKVVHGLEMQSEAFLEQLHQSNWHDLQKALDRLLSDFPEEQACQVLLNVTQGLTQLCSAQNEEPVSESEQTFDPHNLFSIWHGLVAPRLYTWLHMRIRQTTLKHEGAPCLWVQPVAGKHPAIQALNSIYALLVAVDFSRQGVCPVVADPQEEALDGIPLKQLGCKALVVVDGCGVMEEAAWLEWTKRHATVSFTYVTEQPVSGELDRQVQVEHRSFTELFL
ncbi:MerR family transcriptional regulator [Thiomicrorhabdus sp. zzn3]|uniref:MerR family transcriptional regulator n=1 Tax=Thiomicrorhabdus sp. zzn3 TaxID=3039775 RepID=UPI0024368405|nr:MerR family transcriptional regulator [Thiomicrorhabdus sp. zzn3]MDG6777166.1 MerR family transcriptional regulator [Thiomicrorhabdus sp. zzn3]